MSALAALVDLSLLEEPDISEYEQMLRDVADGYAGQASRKWGIREPGSLRWHDQPRGPASPNARSRPKARRTSDRSTLGEYSSPCGLRKRRWRVALLPDPLHGRVHATLCSLNQLSRRLSAFWDALAVKSVGSVENRGGGTSLHGVTYSLLWEGQKYGKNAA
jgi:hypothetical protein